MTLTRKLTLAFLLVAVTAAALVAALIRFTSADRLWKLVMDQQASEFETLAVDYYQRTGTLLGLDRYILEVIAPPQVNPKPPPNQPLPQNQAIERLRNFGVADARGYIVVPFAPNFTRLGMRVPPEIIARGRAVTVDGVFIGTILVPPQPINLTVEEQAYLDRTNQALTFAALGAALLALVVGFLLARTLTRPLRALTLATEKMARGDLNQQVTITSHDEIGELAESFNKMSREVAKANQLRKQMTADIAHDLRTPLTVIAGYVESMRDGDLAPTPERLDTIYAEIERLQRLVADLRLLAHTDAGELRLNLQPIHPKDLLESAAAPFKFSAEQKGIALTVEAADDLPLIQVDESRMNRVLSNLISNALRHTPESGRISILATRREKSTQVDTYTGKQVHTYTSTQGNRYTRTQGNTQYVVIMVSDTGEGIPPADLPHIFERFYRADKSRTDADGASSGLGLAIAKVLVEAQGGRIWVESEVGRGTRMMMEMTVK